MTRTPFSALSLARPRFRRFQPPIEIDVLLDVDGGQHRTGVEAGPRAAKLYRAIATSPGLKPGGLHAYDGHIHDSDLAARTRKCEEAFAPVAVLRQELIAAGLPVPRVVAGGTPTFPMHAKREDVECSPGTCVLWDFGYATHFPDLDFLPAAVLLARVVSKPGTNRLCLDLGHKAVASEMPQPRVQFLNLPEAMVVAHNEEHLVVEAPNTADVTSAIACMRFRGMSVRPSRFTPRSWLSGPAGRRSGGR